MLDYIKVRKYRHLKHLINLWNVEFRSTYPIKKALYQQLILNDENFNMDASFVALYDNEPVGFIFVKTWLNESGFANEIDTAHISLIFVKKELRNMGIGSDLLQLAISELKKYHHIDRLIVGNEMLRVFSGLPNELSNAAIFFVNKGFVQKESAVDMIRIVRNDKIEEIDTKGLNVSIATDEDKDKILQLCVQNGWQREAFLVNKYFEDGGSGRRIALGTINDKPIAIVRFNDESKLPFKLSMLDNDKNLGSINFVKIDKNYDSEEYYTIMNKITKNYLLKRGCKKIVVLATNNVKFYKNLGFSAYKYYLQFELTL